MSSSEKISPTAYATGYFWYRHGLSHVALATPQGRRLDRAFGALIAATRLLSGISLEAMMLARHQGIDALLARAIDEGRVAQVVELAAGLSARGWRFKRRYGARLTYIETDLPAMVATKKNLLEQGGLLSAGHRVVELDARADGGERSLAGVMKTLDPKAGTVVITEGLMNYLDPETARGVWRRIAQNLARFPQGQYLADAYFTSERRSAAMLAFGAILSVFVRGRMHVHFASAQQAVALMQESGFRNAAVHETAALPETRAISRTPGADRVRILEAIS